MAILIVSAEGARVIFKTFSKDWVWMSTDEERNLNLKLLLLLCFSEKIWYIGDIGTERGVHNG